MRRSTLAVIIIVVVVVAAGTLALTRKSDTSNNSQTSSNNSQPSSNNKSASNNSSSQPAAGTINIKDMMFTPSQISVAVGGTVTWTNNDTTAHTVVDDLSNVDGPNSGDIAPGQSYSFKFTKAGSYQYHCSIHPSMRGTIVVK
jgi:plastocyanin